MILSIIIAIVLVIAMVATLITKAVFADIRKDIDASTKLVADTIDSDLDILRMLRIIK